MKEKTSTINPFPGFFLAIIEDSQMENVSFKGDDRFDLPQKGKLIGLHPDDVDRVFDKKGTTYGSLLGSHVMWAKYAESDCLLYDKDLEKDVVLIAIEKMRGYE